MNSRNPNQNYEGTNMVNKYNVDVIHWPPFEEIQQKFLSLGKNLRLITCD